MASVPFTVTSVGVRSTVEHFDRVTLRASNLLPVWDLAEEELLKSNERLFRSEGYGTWEPFAAETDRRQPHYDERYGADQEPGHPMMTLSGRLRAALTQRGAAGQKVVKTPRVFFFGLDGNGVAFYGRFHQTGTSKMPQRVIMRVTRTVRTRIDELIAIYVVEGRIKLGAFR
jgi:hypothetical protein